MNALTPRPFGGWVKFYEEKDQSRFEVEPLEELVFDPKYGFFTWRYIEEEHYLTIPKMVGNGKYWRPRILEMAIACKKIDPLFRGVFFCTKRDPKVYMRVLGGELVKRVHGEGKIYSYIVVNPENTKVKRRSV